MKFINHKFISISLILILTLCSLPLILDIASDHSTVTAATIIVDPNGEGNYTTIQEAIDNASAGDTIRIWAGIYNEQITVNKTLTIIGNGTENTTIDGAGFTYNLVSVYANWTNITGLKFNYSHSTWQTELYLESVNNCSIYNNNFTNSYSGINAWWADFNTIENNTFYNITKTGCSLSESYYNEVNNNTFIKNEAGIYLYFSDHNILDNNTCIDNYLGFWIYSADSNTINNSLLVDNDYGIFLHFSYSNIVTNNTIINGWSGIYIIESSNTIIKNNTMTSSGVMIQSQFPAVWASTIIDTSNTVNGKSIYYLKNFNNKPAPVGAGQLIMYNCVNVLIQNHVYQDTAVGILLAWCDYFTIRYNVCNLNNVGISMYQCYYSDIYNNFCNYNRNEGLYFDRGMNSKIANNTCNYNRFFSDDIWAVGTGIHTTTSANYNIIDNNTCLHNDFGMIVGGSSYNIVTNNTCNLNNISGLALYSVQHSIANNNTCILNNNSGMALANAHYNKVTNNTCDNNLIYGINMTSMVGSDYNYIFNNSCTYNSEAGMYLYDSEYNHIYGNNISNNLDGMHFISGGTDVASYNLIYNNTISYNTLRGFYFGPSSDENEIFHNLILYNPTQAIDATMANTWNNPKNEGNYWSDYAGVDDGSGGRIAGDGIGDTLIPHYGLDNYPFINPFGWRFPTTPYLSDPGNLNSTGQYMIVWTPANRSIGYILEEANNTNFDNATELYNGLQTFFPVNNKVNGTYYYRVRSYNDKFESSWSNVENITVDWLPDQPKNLIVAVYTEGNALNLSWDLNLVDTKGYDIYYTTTVSWIYLDYVDQPVKTYNHSGLEDGTRYYYQVQAMDLRDQLSVFSEIVSAIPADTVAPVTPVNLTVTEITHHSLKLNWDPNTEADLEGYNIYRSSEPTPTDWGQPLNGDTLLTVTEFNDTGLPEVRTYYYAVTAEDEVPNVSGYSLIVSETTKLGPHAPEINNSVLDFDLPEDTYDDSTINMMHWFNDINNDKLTFRCEGDVHLEVTIFQENGTVTLKPEPDWNGAEILTFYAEDNNDEISDSVLVTVTEVNDAPGPAVIVEPENNTEINDGAYLDLEGTCPDPDIVYGDELTFIWTSNISGVLGDEDKLDNVLLPIGEHLITLTVSDERSEFSTATIYVVVKETAVSDSDNDGLPNVWERDNGLDPYDKTDASADPDNDGLSNFEEYSEDTDPQDEDTDNDGLTDGEEVEDYRTDPIDSDTDGDGYNDGIDYYPKDRTKWEKEDGTPDPIDGNETDDNDDELGSTLMIAGAVIIIIIVLVIVIFMFIIKPKKAKKEPMPEPEPPQAPPVMQPTPQAQEPIPPPSGQPSLPFPPPPAGLPPLPPTVLQQPIPPVQEPLLEDTLEE